MKTNETRITGTEWCSYCECEIDFDLVSENGKFRMPLCPCGNILVICSECINDGIACNSCCNGDEFEGWI